MGDDARGYSWPPFERGNLAPVKSGAWSARLVAETVDELRPELQERIDASPWITALDADELDEYLRDRARLIRLERWLAEHGDRYPEGHDRAGELRDRDLREVAALRRRLMDARASLGWTPLARVRMALDRTLSLDVAALMARLAADDDGDAAA